MATAVLDRGSTRLVVEASTDRDAIRAFLERDRLFGAYALADLEDRESSRAKWGIARAGGEI
ncbi:MAG TPA: hypothetical protein VFI15_02750, partial [Candidatus Limnocylindrales bacterium]|nr:hypothetical protein [Candidatus Limnocylindrales bacterium]